MRSKWNGREHGKRMMLLDLYNCQRTEYPRSKKIRSYVSLTYAAEQVQSRTHLEDDQSAADQQLQEHCTRVLYRMNLTNKKN